MKIMRYGQHWMILNKLKILIFQEFIKNYKKLEKIQNKKRLLMDN